jgi:hypothetical protein
MRRCARIKGAGLAAVEAASIASTVPTLDGLTFAMAGMTAAIESVVTVVARNFITTSSYRPWMATVVRG